jgi:hypothetical protein
MNQQAIDMFDATRTYLICLFFVISRLVGINLYEMCIYCHVVLCIYCHMGMFG